jgi:hypothetical protein
MCWWASISWTSTARKRGSGAAHAGPRAIILSAAKDLLSTATLATLFLLATSVAAQTSGIRTYCNPIDIDYKYNFEQLNAGISYGSGADPVIVNHQGLAGQA